MSEEDKPTTTASNNSKLVSEDILNVIQSGQVKQNDSSTTSNKLSLLM